MSVNSVANRFGRRGAGGVSFTTPLRVPRRDGQAANELEGGAVGADHPATPSRDAWPARVQVQQLSQRDVQRMRHASTLRAPGRGCRICPLDRWGDCGRGMVDDLRAGRTQARKKASAAMSARTAQTDAGGNDADAWMDGAYRARSMPGRREASFGSNRES